MRLNLGSYSGSGDPLTEFTNALIISNASPNTVRAYERAVREFLEFTGKDPKTVTSADVMKWANSLLLDAQKLDPITRKKRLKTVRLYLVAIKKFLKWMGIEVRVPVPKTRSDDLQVLTEAQIEKLRELPRSLKYKAIVNLMLDTGLRANEVLSINVEDVNWENNSIVVKNTKNGEFRVVFFTSRTKELLQRYMKKYKVAQGRLFNVSYQALYREIKRLGRKLGIDLRPHLLRHTFATVAIKRGMPLPAVQRLLGHKDIRTTQIYLHLVSEDLRKAYEAYFEA